MRLLAVILLFTCCAARGAEPIPLDEGQTAPYAGVLIDAQHAEVSITNAAEVQRLTAHLVADEKLRAALEATWNDRLKKCEERAWYDDPQINRWGGLTVGVLATVGILAGSAWLLGQVSGKP